MFDRFNLFLAGIAFYIGATISFFCGDKVTFHELSSNGTLILALAICIKKNGKK
jgi:hypothetical protein